MDKPDLFDLPSVEADPEPITARHSTVPPVDAVATMLPPTVIAVGSTVTTCSRKRGLTQEYPGTVIETDPASTSVVAFDGFGTVTLQTSTLRLV